MSPQPFNFSQALLAWHDVHGRKDLPWQQQPTPYTVWLSEIMLQQTQVATVIPYYQRFLADFPSLDALANAPLDAVLSLWTGLGYYARARNLHSSAQRIQQDYGSEFPADLDTLISLPGIGRSTAGAIMALAFHQHFPILDGNVKRVLARFYAIPTWTGERQTEQQLWQRATDLLPEPNTGEIAQYIQAQMDLGATLCTRSKPDCPRCPLQSDCQAYAQGTPTAYPIPKPKKTIPIRNTHWLIFYTADNYVLLNQRPHKGIWGGLWSFAEFDTEASITTHLTQHNQAPKSLQTQPAFRHVFTHFKLDIHPHIYILDTPTEQISNNHAVWYKITDALALGLPAPVKKQLLSLKQGANL